MKGSRLVPNAFYLEIRIRKGGYVDCPGFKLRDNELNSAIPLGILESDLLSIK